MQEEPEALEQQDQQSPLIEQMFVAAKAPYEGLKVQEDPCQRWWSFSELFSVLPLSVM